VNCPVSRQDTERFRTAIVQQTGLQHDDSKLDFLSEVLHRRVAKLGSSSQDYLWSLERAPADAEIAALARELTIGETYFFRHNEQLRALAEAVIVPRVARGGTKVLRLLSAGCASGEEPYSMAMTAREIIADPSWKIEIDAVDLNPAALEKAGRARYSSWALRDTPAEMRRQWFRAEGNEMVLDPALREDVRFVAGNLASPDFELWRPRYYDAIFCRNVLMYFAPERMRQVIARMSEALAPGGFLFLGHAENLRGISDDFHLRHTHETFYYQVKGENEDRDPGPFYRPQMYHAAQPAEGWADSIRQATDRVNALFSPSPLAAGVALAHPPLPWDLAPAFDLLGKERFSEALAYVRGAPQASEKDPDHLLLEAALLVHSGQIAAAEDLCLRLLVLDELSAGAHYLLALCREQMGQSERAREHDRVAAYLDPTFAMPRLHLGLLAGRTGDRELARSELEQALSLLEHEDPARLLLFGGGFNRKALMALCQAALREGGA
jgi:chemotaxis protein methyltransferase CheR